MTLSSKETYSTLIKNNMPFAKYIEDTKTYIKQNRTDITSSNEALILNANAPFEFTPPTNNNHYRYGALLVHGLLDSPFSLRDIALRLEEQGIPSKAILLPGHGTNPSDLIDVTYEDWLATVKYGIKSLQSMVDHLFIIGYSTGAALSIYHALQHDAPIAGLIMLSPAIQIKTPVDMVVAWHKIVNWASRNNTVWFYKEEEVDYAKYRSVPFNAVTQVVELTSLVRELNQQQNLEVPILMVLSKEDDTISSAKAIEFFSNLKNPHSQLLLYTKVKESKMRKSLHQQTSATEEHHSRTIVRSTHYPALNVSQFSHVSIPFAPGNPHYGQHGDFIYASHLNNAIYGAYNRIESHASDVLYDFGFLKQPRHELTYNPDFEFMMGKISHFIMQDK